MIVPAFTFDEPTHEYRLDGVRLPSVTQILAPIKPDFSRVDPATLEAKRALGVAVHLACELDDQGELDDDGTDPRVLGFVAGWRRFRADTGAAILANEQRLYHPALRYAGTLDRLAYLRTGDDAHAAAWILDLKTGDEAHPSFGVQLSGYELLLRAQRGEDGHTDLRRGTVHLREDGTYRLHRFTDPGDEATFIACLTIARWRENNPTT